MSKSKTNTTIDGQIQISKKIYAGTSRTGMYYAYKYFSDTPDRGAVNTAVLDSFELLYAALGLYHHGSKEEAQRVGIRAVSILTSHIAYMTRTIGLPPGMTCVGKPFVSDQNLQTPNPGVFTDQKEVEAELSPELSDADQFAVKMFQSFNV